MCNQAEKALTSYATAVELQPQYAEAHCNMGVVHKQAGRLEPAIAAYEQAFNAASCSEVIRANLAIAYSEKGANAKTSGDVAAGGPHLSVILLGVL